MTQPPPSFAPTTARPQLIGRERELGELLTLVSQERLVTILGPGGMGKTRVVRELLGRLVGASFFCDFTQATDLAEVRAIVADVLGIDLSGDDPENQLAAALSARGPICLAFDNLEQLANVIQPVLSALLAAAPMLRVVGTSRIALRLPEEVLYELGPLRLPESGAALADSDAFRLWVDRVRRTRPSYDPSAEDAGELAALLSELDGNPLAIELCATRARSLSATDLRRMLTERFSLLSAGSRAWEPRHRALSQVIETSWDALTPDQKDALSQLTVFPGTFTPQAAMSVVSLPGGRGAVLTALESLRDQSLLAMQGVRLAIYDSIRAFVEERAGDRADRQAGARARHAEYFAAMADKTLAPKGSSTIARAARRAVVEAERKSLSAVAYGDSPEHAIVCLAVLDVLHPVRDPGKEFLAAVQKNARAVMADTTARRPLVYALALVGFAERRESSFERAEATLGRAYALAMELGMEELAWDLRAERATIWLYLGRPEADIDAELTAVIANGPIAATGRAAATRALMRQDRGELAEARAWSQRALIGLEAASPSELAYALLCLFEIELDMNERDALEKTLARARAIQEHLGDRRLRTYISNMHAWSTVEVDAAAAVAMYEDAISAAPADGPLSGLLLGWQGVALFVAGRYADACVSLQRALALVKAKMQHVILSATEIAARALLKTVPLEQATAALGALPVVTPTDTAWRDAMVALVSVQLSAGERLTASLKSAEALMAVPAVSVLGRLGHRLLTNAVATRAEVPSHVAIAADGTWFERAGEARVSLATQELPARLLAAIADAHAKGTGGIKIADLFAIGWPDEKASPASVEERVRAVAKRLRRAGLGDLLEAHAGGFRITATARIRRE